MLDRGMVYTGGVRSHWVYHTTMHNLNFMTVYTYKFLLNAFRS